MVIVYVDFPHLYHMDPGSPWDIPEGERFVTNDFGVFFRAAACSWAHLLDLGQTFPVKTKIPPSKHLKNCRKENAGFFATGKVQVLKRPCLSEHFWWAVPAGLKRRDADKKTCSATAYSRACPYGLSLIMRNSLWHILAIHLPIQPGYVRNIKSCLGLSGLQAIGPRVLGPIKGSVWMWWLYVIVRLSGSTESPCLALEITRRFLGLLNKLGRWWHVLNGIHIQIS